MKIILIDNYDSFTFNLYHYISSFNVKVDVFRNDKINSKEIVKNKYNKIVISPGPGNPMQTGNCIEIVKKLDLNISFVHHEYEENNNLSKSPDELVIYNAIQKAKSISSKYKY